MPETLPRIAHVISPRMFSSSASVVYSKSLDKEWDFKCFDVTTFVYVENKHNYSQINQFYCSVDGIKWLVSLPFKLIKYRPQLFYLGTVITPEGILGYISGKITRKPIIVADSHWFWTDSLSAKLLWPISRFMAIHSTFFEVVSDRAKKFWRIAGVKSDCVRHGYYSAIKVQPDDFGLASELKKKFENKKMLFFIGRLIEAKGLNYLLQAFSLIEAEDKNVMLIISGDGPDKEVFEGTSKKLKLKNVVFTGSLTESEKRAYFLVADLFVYPSITLGNPEEWGLAVNEAMSVGKPVVVTNAVGCCIDLVKHGVNGYIVQEKNVDQLFAALKKILDDDELRINMGIASKQFIADFTFQISQNVLIQNIKHVYGSVINNN